ncbi:VOC family protein [Nocardiopsis algeriensis]|uniref:VOC domain-containing protein n=1 Tax=Nocardiopsis algeriensis TaxID=1478215 RepID=A0A841IIM6_9ACTN|nr:VOC family protein [Nocardiopsis algeriensis]MBB6118523.1 hypothetical protein [Nocardiopsis algeriensis]
MITTDFLPGSPSWLMLSSPDVDASLAFYGDLFGWEAASAGPRSAGHVYLTLDGDVVGVLGPLVGEGEKPAWTIFFKDPNVDDTVLAVERLGGTLLVEPFDIGELGRVAHFYDPQGGHFAVAKPYHLQGMEVADRPGSLCWVELWTPDGAAAVEFYGELFRWGFTDHDMPAGLDGTYKLITPAGAGQERAHGGIMAVDPDALPADNGSADWHPAFAVADIDAAVDKVKAGGGQVYTKPEDTPVLGRSAFCADPFGSAFSLFRYLPE